MQLYCSVRNENFANLKAQNDDYNPTCLQEMRFRSYSVTLLSIYDTELIVSMDVTQFHCNGKACE